MEMSHGSTTAEGVTMRGLSPQDSPIKRDDEDYILPEIDFPDPVATPEVSERRTNDSCVSISSSNPVQPPSYVTTLAASFTPASLSQVSSQQQEIQKFQQAQAQTLGPYRNLLAQQHLDTVRWKPPRHDTVPKTFHHQYSFISVVAIALLDTTKALDRDQHPETFANFRTNGAYNDQDIESMATAVVSRAIRLYTFGSTNLYFKIPKNQPRGLDAELSFSDCISGFSKVVRNFKRAAEDVMFGRYVDEVLAAPHAYWHGMQTCLMEWNRARTIEYTNVLMAQGMSVPDQMRMQPVVENVPPAVDHGVGPHGQCNPPGMLANHQERRVNSSVEEGCIGITNNAVTGMKPGTGIQYVPSQSRSPVGYESWIGYPGVPSQTHLEPSQGHGIAVYVNPALTRLQANGGNVTMYPSQVKLTAPGPSQTRRASSNCALDVLQNTPTAPTQQSQSATRLPDLTTAGSPYPIFQPAGSRLHAGTSSPNSGRGEARQTNRAQGYGANPEIVVDLTEDDFDSSQTMLSVPKFW